MQRRRSQRLLADIHTTCRNPARPLVVTITNVSRSGCSVGSSDLRPGQTIILDLPQVGHVLGQVVWAVSGHCGIKFSREIDNWEVAVLAVGEPLELRVPIRPAEPDRPKANPV